MANLPFPGTMIVAGSSNIQAVTAIQTALNAVGCGPVDVDGQFRAETFAAVEHFQTRTFDGNGVPLTIDGKVGPSTWAVMFGQQAVPLQTRSSAPSALLSQVLTVAAGEVGVMEVPPGSNRGPRVDQYLSTTGENPADGLPWCACFVYFCFKTAADSLGVPNSCVKTGGVQDHWARANSIPSARRILPFEAQSQPSLVVPGTIFLLKTSGTTGHMGLIEEVQGNQLTTIEGNTNDNGSREGIGVFRRTTRTISGVNLGFIVYS